MSWTLLLNSLVVGLGTTLLALGAGLLVALAVAAASRGRGLLLGGAAACLALPPFLATNAWLDVTADWRGLMSPEVVERGSLFLTTLTLASLLWPLTTFLVLGAWTKLQPELLEADPQLRGTRLLRGLLLPAAHAELTVAAAITLTLALANFTVPVLFQVRVFTEEFWIRFNTQFDTVGALRATWSLLIVPLLLLWLMRHRDSAWPRLHAASLPDVLRQQLGAWRNLGCAFAVAWLALALAFPFARLIFATRTWTELPSALAAGHAALLNTVLTAVGTATVVTAWALWFATLGCLPRKPKPHQAARRFAGQTAHGSSPATGSLWITRLAWLPFLLPGVFLGVALIALLNRPAFTVIYQSLGIVFVALVVRYFAPGFSVIAGAVRSADTLLADAASSLGASRWQAFRDTIWPQIVPSVATAWYAVYLLCLWDVETVVLIQPPGGETLALRIFNLLHYGHGSQVNALCVVMVGLAVMPLVLWGIVKKLKVQSSKLKAGLTFGALSLVLGAFSGCSPASDASSTPLNSKLFSAVQVIGSRGVAPGQFNKPRSLTCDRDDNLYVADITGRIQKFSPDGRFLLQWQMPQTDLGKPKGMGLDNEGQVLVIEPHYMRVNHFTTNGELVRQWGLKGTNVGEFILPRGVAQNARGEFFLSEYTLVDRVQRFAFLPVAADVKEGRPESQRASKPDSRLPAFGLSGLPVPLKEFSPDGQSEPPHVRCYVAGVWGTPGNGPGQFNRAEGLCIGRHDEVLVADSCNHRVQVFDRDGKFLRAFGKAGSNPGEFSYPYDVRVDPSGNQFICEFGNSRITVLDAQDRVIEVIGEAGAAPGKFANPWSIALDSQGNLYVADSQNHRVQKLVRKKSVASNQSSVIQFARSQDAHPSNLNTDH
jgi:ABC-type Fe3+ transport system permease subunit/sugar lactone lactonase YvrE